MIHGPYAAVHSIILRKYNKTTSVVKAAKRAVLHSDVGLVSSVLSF